MFKKERNSPKSWTPRARPKVASGTHRIRTPQVQSPASEAECATPVHRMSTASWSEDTEHDFCQEPLPAELGTPDTVDLADNCHRDSALDNAPNSPCYNTDLDLQIEEQRLAVLTKRKELQVKNKTDFYSGSASTTLLEGPASRSYDADKKCRQRELDKRLLEEAPDRESKGKKRYGVEVSDSGNPIGIMRNKWLACLRGHSSDLDFSVDVYSQQNMSTLLDIKRRVDNTFDYIGGLGKVSEEVFHHILKSQLKMKRYQLKKLILQKRPKPGHVRSDHWRNLAELISGEAKQTEAKKLKMSRAMVKRMSSQGRS